MDFSFQALLASTGIVALAEIGDKTQLLAFMLSARFQRSAPILFAILIATLANHALAGALGSWLTHAVPPDTLRWTLGLGFFAMAAWVLLPDKFDDEELQLRNGLGVFSTTLIAFFLAEMGDKTQVATVALAAQYDAFIMVVVGTTLGMMVANVPAVVIGKRFAGHLPVQLIHAIAAVLFALLGIAALASLRA